MQTYHRSPLNVYRTTYFFTGVYDYRFPWRITHAANNKSPACDRQWTANRFRHGSIKQSFAETPVADAFLFEWRQFVITAACPISDRWELDWSAQWKCAQKRVKSSSATIIRSLPSRRIIMHTYECPSRSILRSPKWHRNHDLIIEFVINTLSLSSAISAVSGRWRREKRFCKNISRPLLFRSCLEYRYNGQYIAGHPWTFY